MVYTIITGASKGIGRCLAEEYAKHGHNLILVARSLNLLESLKEELERKFSVTVRCFPCDLSNLEETMEVFSKINEYPVNCLINNAGIGIFENIEDLPSENLLSQMTLNFNSPVLITKLLLKKIRQNQGSVINLCSVLSFLPNQKASVYCAGKAALYAFSNCLRLEHPDLHVLTVHPITVATGFFNDPKYLDNVKRKVAPEKVAKKTYVAYRRRKRICQIPGSVALVNFFYQLFPNFTDKLNRKYFSQK